jgi:GNAT superfamily N-acetyltransferase
MTGKIENSDKQEGISQTPLEISGRGPPPRRTAAGAMSNRIIVTELAPQHRNALEKHFLALGVEDRWLRFGNSLSDSAVRAYVSRIDLEHDAAFGVFGDDLRLLGVAHLARSNSSAELGVSVLPGHRGHGIGSALLARAHTRARNWGLRALFMHCLTENAAMMHLARSQGMDIVTESGEADAWLNLPPADAASHFGEVFDQRVALFDQAVKTQLRNARRIAGAFTAPSNSPRQAKG